jgi:hypothetical protein
MSCLESPGLRNDFDVSRRFFTKDPNGGDLAQRDIPVRYLCLCLVVLSIRGTINVYVKNSFDRLGRTRHNQIPQA